MKTRHNHGQAALLVIFIIGLFALLIGLSLAQTGYAASVSGRMPAESAKALAAAHSGIEDAAWQISRPGSTIGLPGPDTYTMSVAPDEQSGITISGTADERTVVSVGSSGQYIRKITATLQSTTAIPGIAYAIHAGTNGFEQENTTVIKGKAGTDAYVYSNGLIKGAKNDHTPSGNCKNSASAISGYATAVTAFDKLDVHDSGVCVTKNASSSAMLNCFIAGIPAGPIHPGPDCPYKTPGSYLPTATGPQPVSLPDMRIPQLTAYMNQKAGVFTGDCTADLSGALSDCTAGINHWGLMIIDGNMTINIPAAKTLYINGPVWVKGNLTINSNSKISIDPALSVSQIYLVDKKIISSSNVTFGSGTGQFLMFLSEYQSLPTPADLCTDPAITISSNSNSVLFYAAKGCALITANSLFHGSVLGEKIHVRNNSTVEYDPALASAIFGWTSEPGWEIVSYAIE